MVILGLAVSGIAQLTVTQYITTSQKIDSINQDMLGEALLEEAVYNFESYLVNNAYDFEGYMDDMTNNGVTPTGILVNHVSGTTDTNGDYTGYDGLENRAYRFTYTYNDGNSFMVLYAFISNTGTYTESLDPFDFQLATNGYLILNGGYMRSPQYFGDTIVFTNVSPYINRSSGNHDRTPDNSAYPDFNGNGNDADAYYRNGFYFCQPNCYGISGNPADPFVLQTSEFLNIETEPNSLETGDINEDRIIFDFFGGYELETQLVDFVKNVGPTDDRTISSSMSLANMGTLIWNNYSGETEVECVDTHPSPVHENWVCYDGPSSDEYTRLNTLDGFNPGSSDTVVGTAGIYQGDLIINHDFTMNNVDTETIIVDGDLTFSNSNRIDVEAFFVVLGDLYFTGEDISIGGGFYVAGQTFIEFEDGHGFRNPDNGGGRPGGGGGGGGASADYSFALYTMDNIWVNSLFESHLSSTNADEFNWFVYTEESIYVDAVNNRVFVNGVFFAAAKGNSGNEIPMVDDNGNPVRGIIINSFNGYVRSDGFEVVNSNVTFDFDPMQEGSLQDKFFELPEFETVLVSEGEYTIKRSEIFYNNN
jgi:hypothetical protein